ncbi:MAG TPA: hypothetical protein VKO20_03590 [Desulfosalsimonadaceae bacterium]|nr:hypothetical protein [Desulfosalsimonadaceae bacterium]
MDNPVHHPFFRGRLRPGDRVYGSETFIQKPFSIRDLAEMLHKLLRH